jgi:hypothetical protein
MSEIIHQHSAVIEGADGQSYRARIYGEPRHDGTWTAWIDFVRADRGADASVLRTGQETSQPDRQAVEYWAGGLEPVYLEGALARARRHADRDD